eukprot:3694620-Amphidinium_carterae.1
MFEKGKPTTNAIQNESSAYTKIPENGTKWRLPMYVVNITRCLAVSSHLEQATSSWKRDGGSSNCE